MVTRDYTYLNKHAKKSCRFVFYDFMSPPSIEVILFSLVKNIITCKNEYTRDTFFFIWTIILSFVFFSKYASEEKKSSIFWYFFIFCCISVHHTYNIHHIINFKIFCTIHIIYILYYKLQIFFQ